MKMETMMMAMVVMVMMMVVSVMVVVVVVLRHVNQLSVGVNLRGKLRWGRSYVQVLTRMYQLAICIDLRSHSHSR
jgi:hypothetical protein